MIWRSFLLDNTDTKLLDALQRDATLSMAQLGEVVGLSPTPCWKRVKRLQDEGYITSRLAILDRKKLGLPVTVFVSVRTTQHDEQWLARFAAIVTAMPEVMEFHRMSGDVDYMLKVVASSIDGYDRFYKKLIRQVGLSGVSSAFSMEQIKSTTVLPLDSGAYDGACG